MATRRVEPALCHLCLVIYLWLNVRQVVSAQNHGNSIMNPTSCFLMSKQLSLPESRGEALELKPNNHNEITASVKVRTSILVIRATGMAMLFTLLAGDVSSNHGPASNSHVNFNSVQLQGIKICHWNVQRLTDSKFEEISY